MRLLLLSILAVAMIGLMVPSVFAVTSDSSDVGTVNIQYNTFYQGEDNLLKIFGDVNAYVQSKKLVVIITNPDGTTDGSQIFPTSDGYYETYHSIGRDAQLGSYKVFATYAAETIGTVYFEVLSEAEGEAIKAAEREAAEREAAEREAAERAEREAAERAEREAAEREAAERAAIEAAKPKPILSFVDQTKDPSHYVDRYINEHTYRDWFDSSFPDYTIWEGIGISKQQYRNIVNDLTMPVEPEPEPEPEMTREEFYKQLPEITSNTPQADFDESVHKAQAFGILGYHKQSQKNFDYAINLKLKYPHDIRQPLHEVQGQKDTAYDNHHQNMMNYPSSGGLRDTGQQYLFNEEYEKALSECQRELDLNSNNMFAYACLQTSLEKLDRYQEILDNYTFYSHLSYFQYPFDSTLLFSMYTGNLMFMPAKLTAYYQLGMYDELIFEADESLKQTTENYRGKSIPVSQHPMGVTYAMAKATALEKMGNSKGADIVINSIANNPSYVQGSYSHSYPGHVLFHEEWNHDAIRGAAFYGVKDYSKAIPYLEKGPDENKIVSFLKVGAYYEDDKQNPIKQIEKAAEGGGCLIATASFGSEMAPQVQFLRELRDNTVLQTQSGTTFMTGFNQFYYSFSPTIADYERENLVFKEAVKLTLTPLLTSLAILNYVDIDTEQEMLGYGIGVILLNIGMYFVAPAAVIIAIKKRIKVAK